MLTKRVIPCLDCKNGRVVKGVQFKNLTDAGSPAELSARYQLEGADEIVLLDVSATIEERQNQRDTVADVRKQLLIPLTVGGGVREIADIERLLEAGADKVGINTAAVLNPSIITEASQAFGAQCTVVSVDATGAGEGRWNILTRSGGSEHAIPAVDWVQRVIDHGAGEILLTSLDRDGTQSGYDLRLIEAVSAVSTVPIIASGGAKTVEHMLQAFEAGADAVLAASIFHFGQTSIGAIKQGLREGGIEVRL